ncbi:hypothetical protein [Streptomyces sp. NPDC047108]|uniref:hypothetical protein n=1 Tax=Streptomyces sp. NPDC047108 TaxID=3155025 RepID=UPI0033D5AAA0
MSRIEGTSVTARSLHAAAGVLAATLLTACGGSASNAKDGDSAADANTSGASGTPSATADEVRGRPDTGLPADLDMTFAWSKTGKASSDAVYADGEQFFRGLKRASARHDLKDRAYSFYSSRQGLSYAVAQIKGNIEGGFVPTGTDRYFKGKVAVFGKDSAALVTCRDQRKLFSKDLKTDKVHTSDPDDAENFVLYNMAMKKSSEGIWKVSEVEVKAPAEECMP